MKTLTLGRGKSKRQWQLSDEEFRNFELRYEENELVDMSSFDIGKMKLVETEPPVIVTITCYGKTEKMEREKAKKFYLDCMKNSEGSEQERYTNIYTQLMDGATVCFDEVWR